MKKAPHLIFATVSVFCASVAFSQGEKEEGGTLGGLFNKVKEIKVPDSVTGLPAQITDLKESYLDTAKTVEELKSEVEKLREEVAALRAENAEMKQSVGAKVQANDLQSLMKPIEVSASDLVGAYLEDRKSADDRYMDKYLKVIGSIASFESATQSFIVSLKADGYDAKIRCSLKRDTNLHVEVLPSQGRMISRNDRRTLLTVGQPVAILGTCKGTRLNVEMVNCKIEGLVEKKKEEPLPKK